MTKISQWVTTMASETPGSTVSLVGEGSFLDKPSLHMVGYMGKDPNDFIHDRWCPVCKSKGHSQALKTYRINFSQSIFLCSNPQCIFPLGYTPLDNIIANTVDLQKHPNASKPKKRTISETSPSPLACVKRPKNDLPNLADCLTKNYSQSTKSDLSKPVEVFPALAGEISPPRTLQHCQAENVYIQVEDVPRKTDSLSSYAFALCEKPRSSDVPMASLNGDIGEPFKDVLQEVSCNEVLETDIHKLSETDHLGSSEVKYQKNIMTTLEVKDTGGSNGDLSPLKTCVLSPDQVFISKSSLPSPIKIVSQEKDSSPRVVSSTPCSINYVPDLRRDLVLESVLQKTCEVIQDFVCERLEDAQTGQQVEDKGGVLNAGCAEANGQYRGLSPAHRVIQNTQVISSKRTVSNDVQAYEPDQEMLSGSILKTDPSATILESAVEVDMSGSSSDHGLSQEITRTPPSRSLQDIQHLSPTENNDFHVSELTTASEVNDSSMELSASSLIVCPLSQQKYLDKDVEKRQSGTVTALEGHQVHEKQSLLTSSLEEPQEVAEECQTSPSDNTCIHDTLQGILPECPSEEMSLTYVSDSPVTAVENRSSVNSPAVSLQEHCSSEQLNLAHECQKNDIGKPSLQNIQSLCHTQISGSNINVDSVLISDISLSEPQNLMRDSPNFPCVTSTPCRAVPPLGANSLTEAITTGIDDSVKMSTISLLSGSQLPEVKMDFCETTITPNSTTYNMLVKECHPAFSTVANMGDHGNIKTSHESSCALSMPQQGMKKTNENPVLPDLLLDIQPVHRMEGPLSAAPDPAMAHLSDAELVDPGDKLKQNEATKASSAVTEVLDSSTLSDTPSLETTLKDESTIQDDSMDTATGASKQDSKAPVRTFQNSQRRLQWRNKHSLCWLDCILSALVQSVVISSVVDMSDNKELLVHYLLARYEEASAMVAQCDKKKTGRTKKYEKLLNEVRSYIFDKLKPFLKCELGQKESPVFAFPLLLKQDPEIEKVFEHSFTWNFKCELCGYSYQTRCQKTITTFTNVFPDWRPLNAHHTSPCNKCLNANQKRQMHLEKLHSIFMVHFVEGLPTNDLQQYSFQFHDHLYEIKTVIRYRNEHFSTWIANDDGSWLESDDLKGSFCRRHQKFKVRSEDIHVVMWEKSNAKMAGKENSHLGTAECHNGANQSTSIKDQTCPQISVGSPRQVVPAAQPVVLNTSNPLAGMEGYADDDIITLTLVEVPLDAMGNPINPDLPSTSTVQKEAIPLVLPQPAQMKVPSTSMILPKHDDQNHGTFPLTITSHSVATPVSAVVSNNNLSPVKQNNLTKPTYNMKPPVIATSSPFVQPFSTKKSVVGSWMTSLINKDNSVLIGNLSATNKKTPKTKPCPPLKITDVNGAYKRAQNFDGFQAKSVTRTTNVSNDLQPEAANKLPLNASKEKTTQSLKTFLSPTASGHLRSGNNGSSYGKLRDGSSSSEDRIRKLRLKLLKKLKAKKNELATLERMSKLQQSSSNNVELDLQGGLNRRQHLQGFLQELQDQIDNADNESVCTMSSCTSICSSPGDADFFAELFSPSPVDNPANDGRYLEMLADGLSTDQSQHTNGHKFPMDGNSSQQSTSGSNSYQKTNTLDCSKGDESLNILSSSTLALMNEETEYLSSFDYLF